MAGRKRNGEGTISGPRKDGRYVGAFYALTNVGTVKRVYVYGRSFAEARENLIAAQAKVNEGIPVPAKSWKLGPYLDYWLENVVKPTRRPATYELYGMCIRVHLKPGLGKKELRRLSVPLVQKFLNDKLARIPEGESIRLVEVLGLHWADIDETTIRVCHQLRRTGRQLRVGPVKTTAGKRDLPLLGLADNALMIRRGTQFLDCERLGSAWTDTDLVFTALSGLPVEPRNLNRSFVRICKPPVSG